MGQRGNYHADFNPDQVKRRFAVRHNEWETLRGALKF
jgi:hypothetical protein